MITISDIFERYQGRRVLKSVVGYLVKSVKHSSESIADRAAQEQGKNQRSKREVNSEGTDEKARLPFPDRRKRNIPVLLDTRSRNSDVRTDIVC